MAFKITLALALAFVGFSNAAPPAVYAADYYAYPKYSYSYGVADALTGDKKSAHETRDGDVVKGSYSLLQPDGVVRTVNYVAGPHTGFQAEVVNSAPAVHAVKKVVAPVAAVAPVAVAHAAYGHGHLGHAYGHAPVPVAKAIAAPLGYGHGGYGHAYAAPVAKAVAAPIAYGHGYGHGIGHGLGHGYAGYAAAPVAAYGHHAALGYAGHGIGHGVGVGHGHGFAGYGGDYY